MHVESLVEDSTIKTKKWNRPVKEDILEKAMDTGLTKIMKIQEERDKKMCELEAERMELEECIEAKRMELEECMLEIEERHWRGQLEREDQYRREQQR